MAYKDQKISTAISELKATLSKPTRYDSLTNKKAFVIRDELIKYSGDVNYKNLIAEYIKQNPFFIVNNGAMDRNWFYRTISAYSLALLSSSQDVFEILFSELPSNLDGNLLAVHRQNDKVEKLQYSPRLADYIYEPSFFAMMTRFLNNPQYLKNVNKRKDHSKINFDIIDADKTAYKMGMLEDAYRDATIKMCDSYILKFAMENYEYYLRNPEKNKTGKIFKTDNGFYFVDRQMGWNGENKWVEEHTDIYFIKMGGRPKTNDEIWAEIPDDEKRAANNYRQEIQKRRDYEKGYLDWYQKKKEKGNV